MPQYAEVDGLGTLEFPDEATPDQIAKAVKKTVLAKQSAEAGREIGVADRFIGAVDQVTSPVYGIGRISLSGGLGRLAGAIGKDVLTGQALTGPVPLARATVSDIMGEETPPEIQADIDESATKSGLVKAFESAPMVGTAMLTGGASLAGASAAGAAAMGASAFEASGGSGVELLKGAATGAALPFLGYGGRYAGGLATAAAVNKGVTQLANPIVQRAIEAGAAQVPINALLVGEMMLSDEYRNATPERQNFMLKEAFIGNLAFAGPDVMHAFNPRAQPMATQFESPSVDVARMLGSSEITGIPEAMARTPESTPWVQRYPPTPFAQIPGGPVPASPLTARALQDAQNLLQTPGTGRAMETLESRYGEPAEPIIGERPAAVREEAPSGAVSFGAEAPTLTRNVPDLTAEALRAEARAAGAPEPLPPEPTPTPPTPTPDAKVEVKETSPVPPVERQPAETRPEETPQGGTPLGRGQGEEPQAQAGLITPENKFGANPVWKIPAKSSPLAEGPKQGLELVAQLWNAYQNGNEDAGWILRGGSRGLLLKTKDILETAKEYPNVLKRAVEAEKPTTPTKPSETQKETQGVLTPEERAALQAELDAEMGVSGSALTREMALIPGGRQAAKALSQAAANARRKAQAGLLTPSGAPARAGGARPAQQQQQPAATPPAGTPTVAPPPPGAQPAGGAAPPPAGVRTKTLADAYRVFTPPPEPPGKGTAATLKGAVEKARTGFVSKYRPISEWEENVIRYYGLPKRKQDAAAFFETLKGASGQAQADTMKFDRDVLPKLKGIEDLDFSAYMLAKRIADRLTVDPVERRVANWTVADAQGILTDLENSMSPAQFKRMEEAGKAFQVHMDNALKRQVDSHRMSQEMYDKIKKQNSFYAPFGVMKYLAGDDAGTPGVGRNIDTQAEYTKAIEGINDEDFRLADMIGMARRQIATSRILSEKNLRMLRVLEIADTDTQGVFARRLRRLRNKEGDLEWEQPAQGKESVVTMVYGKPQHIEVNPAVAKAIKENGPAAGDVLSGSLKAAAVPFRAGATTLNAPFQFVNMAFADQPRLALVSKLGPREWSDVVKYPVDFVHSLYSAMAGNRLIPGAPTPKLFTDFLESGAAGATVQEYLTTDAIKPKAGGEFGKTTPAELGKSVLFSPARFAKAIEETTKIMGTKRAMRKTGASSGEELAKVSPELVTEVRRFAGSPDFSRIGSVTDRAMLNLLFVFSNARVQGTAADIGRLAGKEGPKETAKTWAKLAGTVALPTALLAYYNSLPGNREDYEKLSENEKRNYWMFPKNKYVVNERGERVRDYWRAPKRETMKLVANVVESGIKFAHERDPKALAEWGASALEDMAPVNVTGRNLRERGESVVSSMNPLVKAPFELFTGRNTYQHRDVVSDQRQLLGDPEFQYSKRTQEVFKQIAQAMPDWAPEFVRSPARLENLNQNIFAGLFSQFLPTKGVEGRSGFEEWRLLRRFQTQGYVDNPEFRSQMEVLQREQANESLIRERKADEIIAAHKGDNRGALVEAIRHFGEDEDGVERVADKLRALKTGVTREDQQLLNLAPRQRAQFITEQLADMDRENSREYLRTLIKRKVLSEATALEMQKLKMVLTNKAE